MSDTVKSEIFARVLFSRNSVRVIEFTVNKPVKYESDHKMNRTTNGLFIIEKIPKLNQTRKYKACYKGRSVEVYD